MDDTLYDKFSVININEEYYFDRQNSFRAITYAGPWMLYGLHQDVFYLKNWCHLYHFCCRQRTLLFHDFHTFDLGDSIFSC